VTKLKITPPIQATDLTRSIFLVLWCSGLVCLLAQLLLGGEIFVVTIDAACLGVGLYGFKRHGIYNGCAALVLFYVVGNVAISLYIKTILLQPVDSYLFAPSKSYMVELAGISTSVLALAAVSKLDLGAPILPAELDAGNLRKLARIATFLGLAGWVESHNYHTMFGGSNTDGFASFRDLLFLAIICKTAALIQGRSSRYYIDAELTLLLLVSTSLGFLINSKAYTFLPMVAYMSTIFFFEGKISYVRGMTFTVLGWVFLIVVAPLIQVLRFLQQQHLTILGRIALIGQALTSSNYANLVQRLRAHAVFLYGEGYYDYFRDSANWVVIAGRYASVQQIDPVIARVQLWGLQNFPLVNSAMTAIIPHVIYSTKLPFSAAYYILLQLGFATIGGGKSPTLPMAGELYAVYGISGVVFGSLAVFIVFFLILKKLAWNLNKNVFAIFFFVDFTFVYASQGAVEQYLNAALRQFPTFALLILFMRYLINFGSRPIGSRQYGQPAIRTAQGDDAD